MYNFYIDKILLPVTPSKLQIKINNKNKTMTLLNDGEINILKSPGLTEITFDFLLPNVKYPFAIYKGNRFRDSEYYLKKIEKLKTRRKVFRFIVVREIQSGDNLFDTNMKVSLEDYTITDDATNGTDISISIKLKQFKSYSTKTVTIIEPIVNTTTIAASVPAPVISPPVEPRPVESPPTPQTYTVVSGDCLWNICKQYLGDGNKYQEIADLNGIANPNLIYPGQVIRLG
ncbi:LysM domain/BON superfamily protein [Clostridium puniceum]|uniref:LysM domain/BON superfamily protein n=1 Tax=Clostridium puniceum TaxID=29367 RepID=A0A1S8TX96_9CLOT|nr:LysM peptidoglycan-binding domain-containing protein [Clostridium puniceum]OOM82334.1 LysM domain/BON superfamily protein [Clostridium puniceum]